MNCCLGFCLGGHLLPDRTPKAFSLTFDLTSAVEGATTPIAMNSSSFWGAPKIFNRLIRGFDVDARQEILDSGKWHGTAAELDGFLGKHVLTHHALPIREAVDYLHTCIQATIKAMKFSSMPQICGGPIEIATVTTDRRFRWTRHKEWDSAIREGVDDA